MSQQNFPDRPEQHDHQNGTMALEQYTDGVAIDMLGSLFNGELLSYLLSNAFIMHGNTPRKCAMPM